MREILLYYELSNKIQYSKINFTRFIMRNIYIFDIYGYIYVKNIDIFNIYIAVNIK
jgi:hypothetical protein